VGGLSFAAYLANRSAPKDPKVHEYLLHSSQRGGVGGDGRGVARDDANIISVLRPPRRSLEIHAARLRGTPSDSRHPRGAGAVTAGGPNWVGAASYLTSGRTASTAALTQSSLAAGMRP
jgi:hypothetical protein